MSEQITLYTAKFSPCCQRVGIALKEAKADCSTYEINIMDKPEWFSQVNTLGQVPAMTYGGPKVAPDAPSAEAHKLAETTVLLEFVADLFPASRLLPAEPVQRARVRFFVHTVLTKLKPAFWGAMNQGTFAPLAEAVGALQALLPPEGDGSYVLGEQFSLADVCAIPDIARLDVAHAAGAFPEDDGTSYEMVKEDPRYSRFWAYVQNLKTRESFKSTFDEYYLSEAFKWRAKALADGSLKLKETAKAT